MAIGAGPLYANAVMGQAPSASRRDHVRETSLQITTRHDIDIEESEQPSRPDSWSMHYDRTDQAPYSTGVPNTMMTQTSLLNLPKENPSRDLAFFLKTTGPPPPHRRPSKIEEHPRRGVSNPKNAFRFLRLGHKRSQMPAFPPHEKSIDDLQLHAPGDDRSRMNGVLRDEGGLLFGKKKQAKEDVQSKKPRVDRVASPFVQEMSSAGQRYLAIVPKSEDSQLQEPDRGRTERPVRDPSPAVMDSEVSISYADSINSPEVYDTWMYAIAHEQSPSRAISPPRKSSAHLPLRDRTTLRVVNPSSPAPMRRHASNPPTPEPQLAVSAAESYRGDLTEHPAKTSFDASRALTSHPVYSTTTSLPLPKVALPREEFPVRHLRPWRDIDIKHPSPRRFASYPVLLRRASSISSSLYPRSTADSPGPPPKSPLRLRRDQRSIENAIGNRIDRDATPKPGLGCSGVGEYRADVLPIKPTVTTVCTGPIKRPESRGKSSTPRPFYSPSRKDREDRIKARKLRDKPPPGRAIDTLVNASPRGARQRLKKTRPQISIPDLQPAPLKARSSSTASSNTSWKKITESTRTPVSAVPSETTPISATGYTPTSTTASRDSAMSEARMTLSPVMLVAEEIPVPKAKSQIKPARLIEREGKSYTPRPRSASIPRTAMKRRSINRSCPSTRANSPAPEPQDEEAPPLPSPPPNRKLPPTPPASGSEKPKKGRAHIQSDMVKELPPTPMHWLATAGALPARGSAEQTASIGTQVQRRSGSLKDTNKSTEVDARLAALEHQNKLLSAALMAVLKTNGERNVPLADLASFEVPKTPAAWETRIARRKVSDAASSSNGSALEMYMSTRRGSKHGF